MNDYFRSFNQKRSSPFVIFSFRLLYPGFSLRSHLDTESYL